MMTAVRFASRPFVALRCVLAGLCLAASVPPWGWWPLAFVGVALWDRLLAERAWRSRLWRTWVVAAAWLFPSLLWMWDLTAPGYVVAAAVFALYFGLAAIAVPPRAPWRWLALPAAIVMAEIARWTFPFGGVPLATLAMSQANAPLAQTARLGNAIIVSGLVAAVGVALSAAWSRRWATAIITFAVVTGMWSLALVAPRGQQVDEITYALVQGGGAQRTRAEDTDERAVFLRHVEASEQVEPGTDLVLWPENVVSVDELDTSRELGELQRLAQRLDTTLIVGVTEDAGDDYFRNTAVVFGPDGKQVDGFEKVRRVPFGEYVPLRGLIDGIAGEGAGLPARDAIEGTEPAVVHTQTGTFAVVISWEVFFTNRTRDGVLHGGQLVLNPTNGSSYWLTQVQTQQVASSQLRAIETGRWVLQAAPTGFSAVVDDDGDVLARSAISETRVFEGAVPLRDGDTIATRIGQLPVVILATAVLLVAGLGARRTRGPEIGPPTEEPESGRPTEEPETGPPTEDDAIHADEEPPIDGGTSTSSPSPV
jgi:apolipoprotein N-acyltransferase